MNKIEIIIKRILILCAITAICLFFYMLTAHPHPYNTEQVCFNSNNEIVFYASGFDPGEPPVVHINGEKYKNIETNEVVTGACRSSWGASKPKGYEYWKIKS